MLNQPREAVQEMPPPTVSRGKRSYGEILKSSALIGGASLLNLVLGLIRTKAVALILGPAGVGLLGLYGSVSELMRSVAGLGINTSGVRQIAEAVGSGDTGRVARTVTTLRRVAFCSGALGAVFLLIFSRPISWLTFGDYRHTGWVALLALAVFFGDISQGQAALVQGMRRIADLARMNVLGAFYGTLFSIPIIYFYREQGVVPSLVCVAAMGILTSWWYARKVKVVQVSMTMRLVLGEVGALLKLGLVFMASGLMGMGSAYLVRIIVLHKIDLEAAGFFQSAWNLGGYYIAFILQAMGADFYPRLTAVANNNTECNQLVNEQAQVGLLLAGPGVLATLTFAALVINVLYSAEFGPAVEILRWICLGMMVRAISWPLGFVLVAKAKRRLFFWSELVSNLLFVGLVWMCVPTFGLKGAGIASFVVSVLNCLGIYIIVRHLSGFRWSVANLRLALFFVPLVAAVFVGWYLLPRTAAVIFGAVVTGGTGIYSIKTICGLVSLDRFPRSVRRLLEVLKLVPPPAKS